MVPVPTKEDRDDRQTIATVIVFILPHHYSRGGGVGTDSYMAYLRTSHPSGGAKDILGGALFFIGPAGLLHLGEIHTIRYTICTGYRSRVYVVCCDDDQNPCFFFFEFEISTMA